jgi:hypothetical protein
MPSAILSVLYAFQAAYSAYNLYLASISISNLQQYEDATKKAAKYSNIAENQLHKTRTTQASGAITVCLLWISRDYNSLPILRFSSPFLVRRTSSSQDHRL